MSKMNQLNPRELTAILFAFTEEGYFENAENEKSQEKYEFLIPKKEDSDSEEEESENIEII